MKKITLIIIASFFSSCSRIEPIKKPPILKKSHQKREDSKDYKDNRILNYYRELRQRNWNKYKKGQSLKTLRTNPLPSHSKIRSHFLQTPRKTENTLLKPELSQEKIEEIQIEIHQNLTYFCMKKRKSKQFISTEGCNEFTQKIYNQCQEKFPIYRDRSIVNCVKSRLH